MQIEVKEMEQHVEFVLVGVYAFDGTYGDANILTRDSDDGMYVMVDLGDGAHLTSKMTKEEMQEELDEWYTYLPTAKVVIPEVGA